jgi:transcriptional regulator with XRE-family HTH domain
VTLPAGPAALTRIRRAANLTQEQLAELSAMHVRSIRALEIGQVSAPRRSSLERIAAAAGLAHGDLARFLSAWGHVDEVSTQRPFELLTPRPEPGSPTTRHESSPVSRAGRAITTTRNVALQQTIQVGANRHILCEEIRQVVLALTDGVDRKQLICEPDQPVDLDQVIATNLQHCRAGEQRRVAGRGVKVFDFLFGRTLDRGDTHLLQYRIEYGEHGLPLTSAGTRPQQGVSFHGLFGPCASIVLQVNFAEQDPPQRCEQVFATRPTAPIRVRRQLSIDSWRSAHVAIQSPRPGGHGIRWFW